MAKSNFAKKPEKKAHAFRQKIIVDFGFKTWFNNEVQQFNAMKEICSVKGLSESCRVVRGSRF
ncbi:MAG: hypothetical protein J6P72_06435 [Firmicutes bacterium]|nr:hypothetical protein [Bacillota bacterium]